MSGYTGKDDELAQIAAMDYAENAAHEARRQLNYGTEEHTECHDCGDEIPEGRRRAVPGTRYCVTCQPNHVTINKYKFTQWML